MLSSAYNPRSNGLAEACVKNMKHLLQKVGKANFTYHLYYWRNMPRSDGELSPAQMFYGRDLRSALPNLQFVPREVVPVPSRADSFRIGDWVRVQNPVTKLWDSKGVIVDIRDSGRSFHVNINDSMYLRNASFLKHCDPPSDNVCLDPLLPVSYSPDSAFVSPPSLRRSARLRDKSAV